MVRIYLLVAHFERGKYETLSYYLDPSVASQKAIELARTLCKGSYVLVQQLDVYPSSYQRNYLLRVDGEK